jgi:hypothetical protein
MTYAHSDSGFATEMERDLRRRGFFLWKDDANLLPRDDWQYEINQALESCDCVLVLLSPRAVARPEVNREIGAALQSGKPIIRVILQRCKMPPELKDFQTFDMRIAFRKRKSLERIPWPRPTEREEKRANRLLSEFLRSYDDVLQEIADAIQDVNAR